MRQADGEAASAIGTGALDLHAAAVELNQISHEGQAEAKAAVGGVALAVRLHEGLEDLSELARIDADAVGGDEWAMRPTNSD